MTEQTAKIESRCDGCGGILVRQVNQFIDRGQLWWDAEASCASCGVGWCESFESGKPPEVVRSALLAANGPSRLRVVGPAPNLVSVLKVLREVCEVPLPQARELADELIDAGLVGTLVEMEFLRTRLRGRGVAAEVSLAGQSAPGAAEV
ncbi:hypothetical protein ACFPOI_45265 [Nonomuraea angiospora]|uniref:Uncharacterized protein n=1 Tax=Nonomuraea angiospora TaxID=46172 RepID=A0ABR9M050_9ACTN|nr:hypothetical protein [Nonomuraea angiospora]MBE1585975.1 hypothetical protein [Nonomuraea angiospora]